MKVSVITTSYNSGHTIKDTLMSVATQDYANIEHLIIDGGSKDGTMQVVSKIRPRVGCSFRKKMAAFFMP
jgi:Glycosyltransferases involved in cell wall biogenesis